MQTLKSFGFTTTPNRCKLCQTLDGRILEYGKDKMALHEKYHRRQELLLTGVHESKEEIQKRCLLNSKLDSELQAGSRSKTRMKGA